MSLSRAAAIAFLALGYGTHSMAQSGELALPAEFPPASYTANQYVDSTGCAFIRAGLSGAVTWVPRVNRDRSQLCGFQPSLAASPATTTAANAAAIANAPVITVDTPPSALATAAAEMADVGMPTETVASLTTPPPRMPVAQPVSPRVIDVPVAYTAPVIAPVATAPIPRMTMAEICADMDATGQRYMNAVTGVTIRCSPQTQPILTSSIGAPANPATPYLPSLTAPPMALASPSDMVSLGGERMSLAALCQISDATGTRYLNAATGIAVRCGPQVQSPSGLTAPYTGVVAPYSSSLVARATPTPDNIPAPQAIQRAAPIAPPPGYQAVWDDGRLNPNRGLPEGNAQALAQTAPAVTISSMTVPQAVSGHRYVQVGTFADPANAERTAARLQAMGLPIGFANITRNGTPMRVVAAGPFGDAAALQAALQAARSAGFGDAFTRN
jgi:SPOR domain